MIKLALSVDFLTDTENRMGYYLRNRRLGGYKFVREYVIGKYIVNLVCREKKLIIEGDGATYNCRSI